jgi:hypothetical protein
MVASAIPLTAFGNQKVLLATDLVDGVHTLEVTTDAPDSAVVFEMFANTAVRFGTVEAAGVHTLCVTTDAADSAVLWDGGLTGDAVRIGTVETDGVHVLCVTTDEPDSGILLTRFANTNTILGTVEAGGVHTICASDAADDAIAFDNWWGVTSGKNIMAVEDGGDGVSILALDGLASDPPANTVAPAVTGTAVVGSLLSCTTGTWTGSPTITYTYQWKRNGVNIGGATASTYTLVQADAGNTANIKCTVTATNGAGAVPADSNTVAQILDASAAAYFTAAGVSTGTYINAFNTFYIALKAMSLYTKFDRLWVLANEDATAALMCLVSLQNATAVAGPTFTAGQGYAGNGTTQYINTGFNPSTHGVNYTLNSAMLGFYSRDTATGGRDIGGTDAATREAQVISNFWDNTAYCAVNQNTGAGFASGANANGAGLYLGTRTASNAIALYKNGASLATAATASSALPNCNMYVCALSSTAGAPAGFTARQEAMAFFGSGFSALEAAAFDTIVDTLKADIGF